MGKKKMYICRGSLGCIPLSLIIFIKIPSYAIGVRDFFLRKYISYNGIIVFGANCKICFLTT